MNNNTQKEEEEVEREESLSTPSTSEPSSPKPELNGHTKLGVLGRAPKSRLGIVVFKLEYATGHFYCDDFDPEFIEDRIKESEATELLNIVEKSKHLKSYLPSSSARILMTSGLIAWILTFLGFVGFIMYYQFGPQTSIALRYAYIGFGISILLFVLACGAHLRKQMLYNKRQEEFDHILRELDVDLLPRGILFRAGGKARWIELLLLSGRGHSFYRHSLISHLQDEGEGQDATTGIDNYKPL